MEIRQLEAFVNVIDNKSFSKTANRLYLAQPTVSGYIADLEKELGVKLITRTTKEVHPTSMGLVLYRYAQDMLTMHENAIHAIKSAENEMKGNIVIGASTIPAQYYLPKLLSAFRLEYPDISFQIQSGDSACVIEKLFMRKIEIGIIGTVVKSPKCAFEPLTDDRLVIAAPNTEKYRNIKGGKFPLSMLLEEPFIIREPGSGTRQETERFLRKMNLDPCRLNVVAEMEDTESIKLSVSHGLGISILSSTAVEDYRQFGRILTFDIGDENFIRKLYMVRLKKSPMTPIANRFWLYAFNYYNKE